MCLLKMSNIMNIDSMCRTDSVLPINKNEDLIEKYVYIDYT